MKDPFQRSVRLRRLAAWMRDHPARELSRDEAAALAGMAPASFSRFFREQTGIPFGLWDAARRLEQAKALLREDDASVLEVAERAGFGSVRSLERWFMRLEGMTPSVYRSRSRRVQSRVGDDSEGRDP